MKNNQTVVVEGETGSGKTTQIPQFLVEAGYGAIGEGWWVGIVACARFSKKDERDQGGRLRASSYSGC